MQDVGDDDPYQLATDEVTPADSTPAAEARLMSCAVCSKAKSKCVRQAGHKDCDRCMRLQKECYTKQRAKRKRKSIKLTRTAQLKHLESTLENIAHALQQGQDLPAGIDANISRSLTEPQVLQDAGISHTSPSEQEQHDQDLAADIFCAARRNSQGVTDTVKAPTPHPITPHSSGDFSNGSGNENLPLSIGDTQSLLDRYQRLMAPHMPFAVIPFGIDASRLAQSQPFLLQAIITVASFHDTQQQQIMAKALMRQICEKLLMNGEKSLGILQGILIFCNWYNPHLFQPPNHMSLLHLAMALTHDLGIDRAPGNCEKADLDAAQKAHGIPQPTKMISNDERRAVLGTFHLTSTIFTSFRKVDTLAWTPWLAECVNVLTHAREYSSDVLLVKLVQSQRIMQEAMSINCIDAPIQFYAKSFLGDLEKTGALLGNDTTAIVLRLQQFCARIAIWEHSFAGVAANKVQPSELRQRLDGMWRCIEAVKSYIDTYMSLSITEYLLVPFGTFAQFAYTSVVIMRASSIAIDGWDVEAVREHVNFSSLMEEASQRYDAVSRCRPNGISLHNDAFTKWSAKTRWMKAFFDSKQANRGGMNNTDPSSHHDVYQKTPMRQSQLPAPAEGSIDHTFGGFEFVDDTLWTSLIDPSQVPESFDLGFTSL